MLRASNEPLARLPPHTGVSGGTKPVMRLLRRASLRNAVETIVVTRFPVDLETLRATVMPSYLS